jgi:non-specific serine/threonine protein kinase
VRHLLAVLVSLAVLAGCSDSGPAWRVLAPAGEARTEVAGAAVAGRVAVVGGLTASGVPSSRVDLYDPRRQRWIRLPDLPGPRHHAMAASRGGRLYVAGGYGAGPDGTQAADTAWVLFDRRWHPLPAMPEARAAGGAAIVRTRLSVVGGARAGGEGALADTSLYLDLRTLQWRRFRGLSPPREHLGVTSLGGRVYAIGGRTGGIDTNVRTAEVYDPVARGWSTLPDAPTPRGGGGAATADRLVVAAGGEGPGGTIAAVDAYDPADGTWRSLPRSPRPRHGAAVVGVGRTVFQALGGPEPGLTVSPSLLSMRVPRDD